MEDKVLEAKNIYKSFGGVQALNDVSFSVAPAEIHCLVGENGSGKSTFVKTIVGVHAPDSGLIILNGNQYKKLSVRQAIREGVQVIYQDLSLFSYMSVAENIATNKMIAQNETFVNWKKINKVAEEQLEKIGVDMDLKAPIETISIANRQLVAICRALSLDAKILFMDEPTTALTKHEVDRLLSIVADLKKKSISVVFISHKLDEVMEVADQICIFRDGKKVGDFLKSEINEKMLTYHMTGRKVEYPRYVRKIESGLPILEVKNLSRKGNYSDINFKVCAGDIVGIIGLLGSGRTELALTLFGLNPQNCGNIIIDGKEEVFKTPKDSINKGVSMMPENRQSQGCFLKKSISVNVASSILDRLKNKLGFIDKKVQDKKAEEVVAKLRVRTKSVETEVQNLSGGNQQKVVLGKWMVTDPKVLILDSPTVGVDVGSKAEIYDHIQGFANNGMGIVLISDEITEIMVNCNKIIVMRAGKVVGYFNEKDLESENSKNEIYDIMYADDDEQIKEVN